RTDSCAAVCFIAPSHARRISLGQIDLVMRPALQRLERGGLVDVQHRVELRRQMRPEVVTYALGLGAIDYADGALEARLTERLPQRPLAQEQQETFESHLVKHPLVAAGDRWANALAPGRLVPVRCSRDRAGVGREPDEKRGLAMLLPDE